MAEKEQTIKGMSRTEYMRAWRKNNPEKMRKNSLAGYYRKAWEHNRRLTIIRLRGGVKVSDETLAKYDLVREEVLKGGSPNV